MHIIHAYYARVPQKIRGVAAHPILSHMHADVPHSLIALKVRFHQTFLSIGHLWECMSPVGFVSPPTFF